MRKTRLSIFVKLLVPAVLVTTTAVMALSLYFARLRDDDIAQAMTRRVAGYGSLLSTQLRSAIAFDDRETAREVLASVNGEPDIAAVVLFDQRGRRLYSSGAASSWVSEAARGVQHQRVVVTESRFVVVAPVVSLEGPWGTLVVELSSRRLLLARREAKITALVAAVAAGLAAFLVAYVIARLLTQRLRDIVRVAGAVTRGEHDPGLRVADKSADEIGLLGRAFNAMLRQIGRERQRLELVIDHLRNTEGALAEANRDLEARVAERTAALVDSNKKLEHQMSERTRMEMELRQAQKLESVGRLAAGVAHEINTPIQYVADSCTFLKTAVGDLDVLIAAYRKATAQLVAGEVDAAQFAAELERAEADADADYVLQQMPRAVTRSLDGLERVATIVRSLKEFAHPERKERAWADINRAINSTLEIARNEYKYIADLRTELGEIPEVNCHLGELNQAILNIVVNAAHAISSVVEGTDRRGEIAVSTRHDPESSEVVITISDTGSGIPSEILDKIFDPFFTTKEVGKGTGQGLAIVRSVVVDKHNGKLEVDSVVGRGTTFHLRLPVDGLTKPIDISEFQELAIASAAA